jgi:hypothetical protein
VERARNVNRVNPMTLAVAILVLVIPIGSLGCGSTEPGTSEQATPARDPETPTPSPETPTPSSETATPSSETTSPAADPADYVGMTPSGSLECYTFYTNGTVELRYAGATTPAESGRYQGDANGGEIVWNSGTTSPVVSQGGSLTINGRNVSPIDTCTP